MFKRMSRRPTLARSRLSARPHCDQHCRKGNRTTTSAPALFPASPHQERIGSFTMRPNILITSAGRRGKLLQAFQSELESLVPVGKVFAADARPGLSVACHLADRAFVVPRASDPTYSQLLLELCLAHDIGLVVPTIDPELAIL